MHVVNVARAIHSVLHAVGVMHVVRVVNVARAINSVLHTVGAMHVVRVVCSVHGLFVVHVVQSALWEGDVCERDTSCTRMPRTRLSADALRSQQSSKVRYAH